MKQCNKYEKDFLYCRNIKGRIMLKNLLLACVLLSSTQALAAVKCPEAKIQMLRPTAEKLVIQLEGQNRHVLALQGDKDYNKKLSRAISAQKNDLAVELQFPNGYDDSCMITDLNVVAKKIKVIKKKKNKGN